MDFVIHSLGIFRMAAALLTVSAIAAAAPATWAQTAGTVVKPALPAAVAGGASVSAADSQFIVDMAKGHMAEVEAGKLAIERTPSADVKKFARQMVADHGKALKQVRALASGKQVTLPDGPDTKHKTVLAGMKLLKGSTFDIQYAKRAGIGDHQALLSLLKKAQAEGADADLKALAAQLQPGVESHLVMARELAAAAARK